MSDAREFLRKWVNENIKANTAAVSRLAEECLWQAQRKDLSEAEVTAAAGGNLLAFMISELNRAAERGNSR